MSTNLLVLLEGLLIAALVFGFGFRELYLLRKDRREREAREAEPQKD